METEQTFELKRGTFSFLLLIVIPICVLVYAFLLLIWKASPLSIDSMLLMLVLLAIPTLMIYFLTIKTYCHSKYVIKDNLLICQMGLFKSTVFIDQINYVAPGEYSAGKRPALHTKGIEINHRVGEHIFISPLKQNEFITTLLKANPDIKIRGF